MAHEINNPLASIVNVVYLAKNEPDPERVRAVATGGLNGLLMVPAAAIGPVALPYPIGTADVAAGARAWIIPNRPTRSALRR